MNNSPSGQQQQQQQQQQHHLLPQWWKKSIGTTHTLVSIHTVILSIYVDNLVLIGQLNNTKTS